MTTELSRVVTGNYAAYLREPVRRGQTYMLHCGDTRRRPGLKQFSGDLFTFSCLLRACAQEAPLQPRESEQYWQFCSLTDCSRLGYDAKLCGMHEVNGDGSERPKRKYNGSIFVFVIWQNGIACHLASLGPVEECGGVLPRLSFGQATPLGSQGVQGSIPTTLRALRLAGYYFV